MQPHIHISALNGIVVALYVLIILATIHIIARRHEGHPFADAVLDAIA